jgi:myo-inositol 2-dehydrogenase/D-chiro-inositol 1-dehydrogenase
MRTLRIGVIGAGSHGQRYLKHARHDVEGLEPVACCRRDAAAGAEVAARFSCRHLAASDDLIADPQVDAVVVCTPPSSHFALARDVLAAGKPLLLEKPMTGTLEEARRLCELDAAAGAPPLFLAQILRWNPAIRRARELWPQLGRVHMVRLVQRLAPTELAWQRDAAQSVGGSVLLTGVHLFDLTRYLTGQEFALVDSRQRQVLHDGLEDHFLARAELADGAWVSLEVGKYTRSISCWLEAAGEEGQLWADYRHGGVLFLRGGAAERHEADASMPTLPSVLAAWRDQISEGAPPPVTATDGLRTLEMVAACYRSQREQRPVRIEEL